LLRAVHLATAATTGGIIIILLLFSRSISVRWRSQPARYQRLYSSSILFPRHATRPINVAAARFLRTQNEKKNTSEQDEYILYHERVKRAVFHGHGTSANTVGRRLISNRGCAIITTTRGINPDQIESILKCVCEL